MITKKSQVTPTLHLLVELAYSFKRGTLYEGYFRVLVQAYIKEIVHESISKQSVKELLDEIDFSGMHQNEIFATLYARYHPVRNIVELTDKLEFDKRGGATLPISKQQINRILES